MREKDSSNGVLISMDSICAQQKLNLILSAIFCWNSNSEVGETIDKFLPVINCSLAEGLKVLFILDDQGNFSEVSIVGGSGSSTNQERA